MILESRDIAVVIGLLACQILFINYMFFTSDLEPFIVNYKLQEHRHQIKASGCSTIVCLINKISNHEILNAPDDLLQKFALIRDHFLLHQWLSSWNLLEVEKLLHNQGINSIAQFIDGQNTGVLATLLDHPLWPEAAKELVQFQTNLHALENKLVAEMGESVFFAIVRTILVFVVGPSILLSYYKRATARSRESTTSVPNVATQNIGFMKFITGRFLSPKSCRVVFDWKGSKVVGETMKFTIKFYQANGYPYPICDQDNILIEINQGASRIAHSVQLGDADVSSANLATVHFTVRRSGEYQIAVMVNMTHIKGSPFAKEFLAGPPDSNKTTFIHHCSTVVGSMHIPTQLYIEPRDKYGNLCVISSTDPSTEYTADILEVNGDRPIPDSFHWECYPLVSRLALILNFPKSGCYQVTVSYKGQDIQNGNFHMIVLSNEEDFIVQKNVAKKNKWYEVKLVTLNDERFLKPKKVFCYISPKQLTLKEFKWKFFPVHLATFRLCPSTKFRFQSRKNQLQGEPILVIDDGNQEVELISPDRNIIAATFAQFLLKNIGGSETFKDKQDFFHHEVRKHHLKHTHDKISVKINRENLLETSFKETKGFGVSDWCKNFEITFIGEEGLDYGGLRREWFQCVCSALFDPENLIFHTFKSDKQGLVHPCPSHKRAHNIKLKHFEFAGKIVGKCLYESALGSSYRQLVKAKFSRSFLAQLIGLTIHYKYFEHDDPDLYVTKIKYIVENDIEAMGLTFTEEIYDSSGKLIEQVDLICNGSNVKVTNENKMQYLNSLAQYRLVTSVKQEIEHFLKGLSEIIPDDLLCIFDENELELLMCGTGSYSISDFRSNYVVSTSGSEFRRIVAWFWIAATNFSEEEMARLLQFSTGSSQLPPGGFSELTPKFQITASPNHGSLPTSHTCFNQLCLPDYDSYEQFEKALRLAINEGYEGFGLT